MKRVFWVLTLLAISSFAIAGDLNPPAAPGSTMKTLGEVEPRIPLGQADFPVSIHQSGSYYLTENVATSAMYGFFITADNVSIDLMGFTVTSSSGGDYGVRLDGVRKNIKISNGTFDGFGYYGIYNSYSSSQNIGIKNVTIKNCGKSGIQLASSGNCIENCQIINCGIGGYFPCGINVGSQSRVINCLVKDCGANSTGSNGFVYAIRCGESSQIIGNIVEGNYESSTVDILTMIRGTQGSVIKNNTVIHNCENVNCKGFYGIYLIRGSACIGNCVSNNASQMSSAYGTYGIMASYGCVVKGNSVYSNFLDSSINGSYGLYARYGCVVDSNTAYSNVGTNFSSAIDCVLGDNVGP